MPAEPNPVPAQPLKAQLENAITMLMAQAVMARGGALQTHKLVVEALRAALAEHELVQARLGAPELQAMRELDRLRQECAALRNRQRELEAELTDLRQRQVMEKELHAMERKELNKLEQKGKALDELLTQDPEAFRKFMDKALQADEQKRRGGRK